MDWLGRGIFNSPTQKQVSSVAEQMGTHDVISEDFALCGHSVSFAELKGIFEWQAGRGINRLCPHLEGYSLRGIRKRDYPPAMYVQQPWWSEYRAFTDAISRECMLLSEGIKKANVLLIHPMTEAWALFDGTENSELYELNQKMLKTLKTLDGKHVAYHFGDETVMERHARVEGDRIVIGDQTYDTVILLGGELLDGTRRLLDEYRKSGGRFSDAEALSDNTVVDREDITYTSRGFADGTLHFFVNTSPDRKTARFTVKGRILLHIIAYICNMNTKMIITGDMTQIDLPHGVKSGLRDASEILRGVEGISFIEMNKKDIVRHKLVTRIVEAYDRMDKERKAEWDRKHPILEPK